MKTQYKGYTIATGNPMYTHNAYTIKKGSGMKEQYFGGAESIREAKEKIDNGIKRIY